MQTRMPSEIDTTSSTLHSNLSTHGDRILTNPSPQVSSGSASDIRGSADLIARTPVESPGSTNLSLQRPSTTTTFAEELRSLSLEATAERHVGSTSGVSFAKLTQMVLRRLSPDKVDFVFANERENTNSPGPHLFNFNSPLDLADHTLFERLNESISIQPSLFGDLGLADIVQPGLQDTPATPNWQTDEAHVNRLVDFYFAHSHTLYPMIHRGNFLKSLQDYRDSGQNPALHPPVFMFRMWMVLAIGSTAYSAISLADESEPRMYYFEALQYLEPAMSDDFVIAPLPDLNTSRLLSFD